MSEADKLFEKLGYKKRGIRIIKEEKMENFFIILATIGIMIMIITFLVIMFKLSIYIGFFALGFILFCIGSILM